MKFQFYEAMAYWLGRWTINPESHEQNHRVALRRQLSISCFWGRSNEQQEFMGHVVKLSPHRDSAALRQLKDPSIDKKI